MTTTIILPVKVYPTIWHAKQAADALSAGDVGEDSWRYVCTYRNDLGGFVIQLYDPDYVFIDFWREPA